MWSSWHCCARRVAVVTRWREPNRNGTFRTRRINKSAEPIFWWARVVSILVIRFWNSDTYLFCCCMSKLFPSFYLNIAKSTPAFRARFLLHWMLYQIRKKMIKCLNFLSCYPKQWIKVIYTNGAHPFMSRVPKRSFLNPFWCYFWGWMQ